MMKKKISVTVIAFLIAVTGIKTLNSNAVDWEEAYNEKKFRVTRSEECNDLYLANGGINRINGYIAEDKDNAVQLESFLESNNYVQISGQGKDISDEEYELLMFNSTNYMPSYAQFMNRESDYYWDMFKVYMEENCYERIIKALEQGHSPDVYLEMASKMSQVVVNYAQWYESERVGKVVNEYNNSIPSWYDTGFMQIECPIDVKLTVEFNGEETLNEYYIQGGVPLLLKVKQGLQSVIKVNDVDIEYGEVAVLNKNRLYVLPEHTIDNPLVVSLEEIVTKFNLNVQDVPTIKDKEKPPTVDYREMAIPEEHTILMEREERQKKNKKLVLAIMGGTVIVCTAGTYLYIKKKKKENNKR